jgi:cardiolipin synthase C
MSIQNRHQVSSGRFTEGITYGINLGIAFSLLLAMFLNGCATLPTDYERSPSYVIQHTEDTRLARVVTPTVIQHPGQSGFYPLVSGMEAFVMRAGLIENAERSLDIQYYIWRSDTTGTLLVDRLLRAADRGVRIRLLLDDLDTEGKDRGLMKLDAHPNIEIRLFNPFAHRGSRAAGFITDLSRVNQRMHNKSLTADNVVTIVGGRNIGNEYFGAQSHAEFSDFDVLAAGPVVKDVSAMFDKYWNSDWAIPVRAFNHQQPITADTLLEARASFNEKVHKAENSPYVNAIRESDLLEKMPFSMLKIYWGKALLLYDDPVKVGAKDITAETHLAPNLSTYISKATRDVDIVSPYFVPGKQLVNYLGDLVDKGVCVRVLTNSLAANDVSVVHAGYMHYRVGLLKRGIRLYEYKSVLVPGEDQKNKTFSGSSKASLHAKVFVLDKRMVFVGSFNLDPRSVVLNTEMGILFESPELAEAITEGLDNHLLEKAYRLELDVTPAAENPSGLKTYSLRWLTLENGKEIRYDKEPDTTWWQRFSTGFLSIFVIESFL